MASKKKDNEEVAQTSEQRKLEKLRQFRNRDMSAKGVVEPTISDSTSVVDSASIQPGVEVTPAKLPQPASMDNIPSAEQVAKNQASKKMSADMDGIPSAEQVAKNQKALRNSQIQQQKGGDADLSVVSDSTEVKNAKAKLPKDVPVTPEAVATLPKLNKRNSYMGDSLAAVSKNMDSIFVKKAAKYKDTDYKLYNRYGNSMNCSSFVEKVLTDAGYNIPKNDLSSQGIWANTPTKSKSMYKDWTKIPDSKLQDGTIIAFDTGSHKFDKGRKWGIDHIGIIVRDKNGEPFILETSSSRNAPSLTPYKKRMAELSNSLKSENTKKGYGVYLGKYEKS
jgi:cell wall-associated NlpC family hydrolase